MWDDTHARLPVDPHRRYVAGIHPLRLIVERASDAPAPEDLAVSSSRHLVQAQHRNHSPLVGPFGL